MRGVATWKRRMRTRVAGITTAVSAFAIVPTRTGLREPLFTTARKADLSRPVSFVNMVIAQPDVCKVVPPHRWRLGGESVVRRQLVMFPTASPVSDGGILRIMLMESEARAERKGRPAGHYLTNSQRDS